MSMASIWRETRWVRRSIAFVLIMLCAGIFTSCSEDAPDAGSAPAISDIRLLRIEPEVVSVSWRTDVPSTGEILVGSSRENLSRSLPIRAITTVHRAVLDSLAAGQTCYFKVVAHSVRGARSESEIQEVTTPTEATHVVIPETDPGYDVAVITTSYGEIIIRFHEDIAPSHCANFKRLVADHFYDGTTFHRVIPGFMIQGGDPNSKDDNPENDGRGGPGYTLNAELGGRHTAGAVAAARLGGNNRAKRSNGSQFYICVAPQPQLDGEYSVFAQVVRGMSVVQQIVNTARDMRNDRPYMPMTIERVRIRRIRPGEEP